MRKALLILALASAARADTIELSLPGNGPSTYAVTPFDSSLGMLTQVDFIFNFTVTAQYTFSASPQYISGVNDSVQVAQTEQLVATLTGASGPFASYQNSVNLIAPGAVSPTGPTSTSASAIVGINKSLTTNLSPFLQNWSVKLSESTPANFVDWGAGAQPDGVQHTVSSGEIDVFYTYNPVDSSAAVPEPGFMLPLTLAMAMLILFSNSASRTYARNAQPAWSSTSCL